MRSSNNSYSCWCFLILLLIVLSSTTRCTTTNNNKIDDLTALLNDVAKPKLCGSNLQKYKIDLDELWWSKFSAQVKKATHLTHLLNHMISSLNATSTQTEWQLIVDNIMETNFLESLSYFMLTGGKSSDATSSVERNIATAADYDKFLIGYGVVLDEELDANKEAFRCKLITQNSNSEFKSKQTSVPTGWESQYYVKDEECSSLNIKEEESDYDIRETSKESGNVISKLSNSISNQDKYKNCLNWYPNLVAQFAKLDMITSSMPAHMFLNQQLANRTGSFTKSVWCGPYNECETDILSDKPSSWILNFHLPLFSTLHTSRMRGAVLVKLRINNLDVNQCSDGDPVFAHTHKCKPDSECVFAPRGQFGAGNYVCKCRKGYLNSNGVMAPISGEVIEKEYWKIKNIQPSNYTAQFNCVPCPSHECCQLESVIMDETNLYQSSVQNITGYYDEMIRPSNVFYNCRVYNTTLRNILLAVQIVFILFTLSIAGVIFYFRQNKIVKYSMWILMEITLLGALFLYFTIVIQYFEPNTGTCLALPWFRELGFTIVYGILNLRLYKILVEFQSRKAHVVHIKDNDILRLLSFMTICVLGYLTAWTLVDLDYAHDGFHLVTNTSMKSLVQYPICKIKWWDYFIEMAEFIFVCVGFYLLYCTRTAPSEFNERKFISIVIYCEGIVSTLLHIIKHSIYSSIHPDTVLILYFIRCHTTVTVLLVFVFITKLLILFKPNSEEYCRSTRLSTVVELGGAPEQLRAESVKFQTGSGGQQQAGGGLLNADYDTSGEFNLTGVKNEEIRAELKRLYTQLYLYKSRSLKADNPHIQAKRKVAKGAKNSTASSSTVNTRRQSSSLTPSRPITTSIGLIGLGARAGGGGEGESSHMKTPDESICSNDVNVHHSVSYSEDR